MIYLLKKILKVINIDNLLFKQGWIVAALFIFKSAVAQNVGIGTNNPQVKLHVIGTVRANQIHSISSGQFDTRVAINAPVNASYRLLVEGGHTLLGGNLNVANDAIVENNFRVNGRLGINGATHASYGLMVNSSNSYFQGNITATGTSILTGAVTTGTNLSVGNNLNVAKDAIISENLRTNGRVGIGGPTNGSYQLFVNNGNSYFQGNTITSGNPSVLGNLTIKGNGSVRSAGPSHLRVGFVQHNLNFHFGGVNQVTEISIPITPIQGTSNDVKVMIAQFEPEGGAAHANWFRTIMKVNLVNTNNNTCVLKMQNLFNGVNHVKGTLHLLVVARDL